MKAPRVLVIDNYDSFTYNLVQLLGQMDVELVVRRNDVLGIADVDALRPDCVVISPGPKRPEDAGISIELILTLGHRLPILGVCLGHQCIGQAFGAPIVKDRRVYHGKTSPVHHDGRTIYRGVESPFTGARYHSLVIAADAVPECLQVTAHTEDGVIMGVRHVTHPIEGVQFHPESFLTPPGFTILQNFLATYLPARDLAGVGGQTC